MILLKLLFFVFFVFPFIVFLLGVYALLKLRSQLFKSFDKTSFNDLHTHAPPPREGGNVIEGEYTVVEEQDKP
jgi:hypothetical protein